MKNGNTTEFITRETVFNEGAVLSEDPRVDSPTIKVVFPPQEIIQEPIQQASDEAIQQTIKSDTDSRSKDTPKDEEHVCEVTLAKAFQQNWIVFTISGAALILIGYLIGKSR